MLGLLLFLPINLSAQHKAIQMDAFTTSKAYQISFDDKLLGTHVHDGSMAQDKRVRNLTLSTWIKPSTLNGDLMGCVQANYYTKTGSFAVRLTDGELGVYSRYMGADGSFPGDVSAISNMQLSTEEWAFITLVINDTDKKLSLYKNGELVLEKQLGGIGIGLLRDESLFFVGCNKFWGAVEEIQLWKKIQTQEEIKASMTLSDSPTDLVYRYTFNTIKADFSFTNQGAGGVCAAFYNELQIREAWTGSGNDGIYSISSRTAINPTLVEGTVGVDVVAQPQISLIYDKALQQIQFVNAPNDSFYLLADLSGQTLMTSPTGIFNVSALSNACYLVQLRSVKGNKTFKFIKH